MPSQWWKIAFLIQENYLLELKNKTMNKKYKTFPKNANNCKEMEHTNFRHTVFINSRIHPWV